jgi:hypothetical protein
VNHLPAPLLTDPRVTSDASAKNANANVAKAGAEQAGKASHFGAKDWNTVTARKLGGVLELLTRGRNVLFIDVDIAVVRADLVEHAMSKYMITSDTDGHGPDFIFQLNVRDPPPCAREEDPANRELARKDEPTFNNINSGFYFLRSNARGIELIERAIKASESRHGFFTLSLKSSFLGLFFFICIALLSYAISGCMSF